MISLEEKLRPRPDSKNMSRDIFTAGILLAMSILLLPAWLGWGGEFQLDVAGQLASYLLPAAMGFMLALRCGAIDLSIWVTMSASGALAGWLINNGTDPTLAFLAAGLVGLIIGAVNGLLVAGLKIPSFLATLAVGLGMIGLMQLLCNQSAIVVADNAFDSWVKSLSDMLSPSESDKVLLFGPLITLRMLLVSAGWTAVLLILMLADGNSGNSSEKPIHHRRQLFFAMCASGVLASLSGTCWLLDLGRVAVTDQLVHGLTIPTAVILAGGALLIGRGRTMLAGIFLPLALLLTNIWSQTIWPVQIAGRYVQLAAMLILLGGADIAFLWCLSYKGPARWIAWLSCIACTAGFLIIPASIMQPRMTHHMIFNAGLAVWLGGIVLLIASICWAVLYRRTFKTR